MAIIAEQAACTTSEKTCVLMLVSWRRIDIIAKLTNSNAAT